MQDTHHYVSSFRTKLIQRYRIVYAQIYMLTRLPWLTHLSLDDFFKHYAKRKAGVSLERKGLKRVGASVKRRDWVKDEWRMEK